MAWEFGDATAAAAARKARDGVSRPPRSRPGRQAGLKTRLRSAKGRKAASTRWLQRQLGDSYVAEAKRLGLRSRAAFKLMQLDDRFHLLQPGGAVLDLGAAPGGWTQVAVARAGGPVVGVDLQPMEAVPGACRLLLDLGDSGAPARLGAALPNGADVVLSDMAPRATGHAATDRLRTAALAELAYDTARMLLRPGGAFVVKVFQGGAHRGLLEALKRDFAFVRHAKPDASRKESSELYLVATGFRAVDGAAASHSG